MISLKDSAVEAVRIVLDTVSWKTPDGITTGYPRLDNLTRGMQKGSLTLLVSPPSLGKTAFALNVVANLTDREPETPILYCSGLCHTELTFRLLAIASGAVWSPDRDPRPDEAAALTGCVTEKQNAPLFFEELRNADGGLPASLRESCAGERIGLLIVDPARRKDLPELKLLARELDIPVLALLSDGRKRKPPLDPGAADTVIRLVRDRHEAGTGRGAPAALIVTRNRFGMCGTCRMDFFPHTMRFRESGCGI